MQFVKPLNPDFVCKVCKEPWDPEAVTQCESCQTTFCKACYDEAMMKEAKCHSCDKQPATFKNVHMLVRSMASNLKVFCRYKSHGCSWEGVRTSFESHTSSCPHKPKEFSYVDESAIPPELMCPICNQPFSDPVQLPCEDVFCRPCVVEALKRNSSCPVDRSQVTLDSMTAPPKLITEILDELPVKCAHHDATVSPCSWTGRRRDYIGHRALCKGGMPSKVNPVSLPVPVPTTTTTPAAVTAPTPEASANCNKITITPMSEFKTLEREKNTDLFVMAHLTAPKLESLEQRKKPLSISAVIDISGSMAGSKLKMAQESLDFMISELSDRDELGIIAFHTDVEQTFPLGKMDEAGKKSARDAVSKLAAKNCTNLSGGLFAGLSQVERRLFDKEDFNNYYADGGLRKKNHHHHHHHHPVAFPPPLPVMASFSPEQLKKASMTISYYTCTVSRNGGVAVHTTGLEITLNHSACSILQSGQINLNIMPHGQRVTVVSGGYDLRPDHTYKYNWESPSKIQHIDLQFERTSPVAAAPYYHPCSRVGNYQPARPPISSSDSSQFAAQFHRHTIDLMAEGAEFNTEKYDFDKVARRVEGGQEEEKKKKACQSPTDSCRAVILFTDGVANGGITSEDGLKRIVKQRLDASPDIVVHTFGFGTDHNARMLQGLADIASGSYYFIQDVATMKESFADCLGGLMSTVAQNIELSVTCPRSPANIRIKKIHTAFPVRQSPSGDGSQVVSVRDLYSTEARDILVQLSHTPSAAAGRITNDVLTLVEFNLQYDSLLSASAETAKAQVNVAVVDSRPFEEKPDPKIDEQRARIELTEALAEARTAADRGDVHLGRERLFARKEAMKAKHAHSPYFNAIMEDMVEVEQQMATPQMWADGGSKHCAAITSCHVQQRMNRSDMPMAQSAAMGYDNSWKAAMRKKSKK